MGKPRDDCPFCKGLGFIKTDKGVKKCSCIYESFDINRFLNIPKRFEKANFENLSKVVSPNVFAFLNAYVDYFKDYYKKGNGLILIGKSKTGKTYSVIALLKEIYKRYRIRGIFFDTKELSIKLKMSISQNKYHRFLEVLAKISVLVLDDLGNEELTDWYREILNAIINYRYNEKKIIFITTTFYPSFVLKVIKNYNKVDFDKLLDSKLGSNTVSRLAEMTIPIVFRRTTIKKNKCQVSSDATTLPF